MAWMLANAQRICYVHQQMNTHKRSFSSQVCGAQVALALATRLDHKAFDPVNGDMDISGKTGPVKIEAVY